MNTDKIRDVEKDWEFWKDIVFNPDGSINVEQLKKELSDFSMVMETASKVYMHITDGKISKVTTLPEVIISEADDCYAKNAKCDAHFFSQDNDSHWYMIPVEKRTRWNELCAKDNGDNEEINDAINTEFGEYRTGGGIDDIEFTPND